MTLFAVEDNYSATRFNRAQTEYHTRDKLLYFTIKFKSIMHTKGYIVVVANGHNILTCIYISIYVSIRVRLSFPLWTTNFCKKCDTNSLPTRSCRLVIPREGYPACMTKWRNRRRACVARHLCDASCNLLISRPTPY